MTFWHLLLHLQNSSLIYHGLLSNSMPLHIWHGALTIIHSHISIPILCYGAVKHFSSTCDKDDLSLSFFFFAFKNQLTCKESWKSGFKSLVIWHIYDILSAFSFSVWIQIPTRYHVPLKVKILQVTGNTIFLSFCLSENVHMTPSCCKILLLDLECHLIW